METLRELLGEELFEAVCVALRGKGHDGRDVELAVANDGSYLPKGKFDALLAENRDLKERLSQGDGMTAVVATLEEEKAVLSQALSEAEEKMATAEASWQSRMDQMTFDHALDNALTEHHVKNGKAVRALLDMDAIGWEDGSL
ncbi:MAG: phage scaffolding protein, partial [Bacillota bacterium]|nr:phage scaffolding protein [Bacillota bacterium]